MKSNTDDISVIKDNNNINISSSEQLIDSHHNQDDESLYKSSRSLFNRLFGKLEEGSLRGSILSLSILCVGVGCLSLPQRYSQIGIIIYSLLIIATAIVTIWSLKMIVEAGRKANLTEYSSVILHYCGHKWGKAADIIIIIYIFGVLIVYQIVIYQMLGAFVFQIRSDIKEEYNNDINKFYKKSFWGDFLFKSAVMLSISVIIIFPLNIQKNISKLRYASFVGIASLIIIVLVLIIQLPDYLSYNFSKPETKINIIDFSNYFKSPNFFFFKAAGTIFYAFSSHYGIFPIYERLKNHNERRINKVINRSIIIICIFFITIGVVGYLTDPVNTHDLIIKRDNLYNGVDYIMTICRLFVVIVLFAKIPNNYNSMRISLFNIFIKSNENEEISLKTNLCLTIPVTLITAFVGVLYDKIDNIISFLGGFCASLISFILPAIIYFKSNNVRILSMKGFSAICLFGIMSLFGLTSATLSFIDFIKNE